MKREISQQIFEKYSNTKFHKNPFTGSRVVPCGMRDERMDEKTDMTKLIFVSRNCANAPKTPIPHHNDNPPSTYGSTSYWQIFMHIKHSSLFTILSWSFSADFSNVDGQHIQHVF